MMTKSMKRVLAGSILLSVGLVGAVAAADATDGSQGRRGQHDPASLVQRFDQNKNGKLEVSELPERMQKRLSAADTNRDGVLSVDELKAHAEARRAEMFKRADKDNNGAITAAEAGPRWERLQVADADHNGSVTRAELDQARAEGKLGHGGHGRGGHCGKGGGGGQMFEKADKNKDGALTSDEVPAKFWEHLVKADANHDGRVTKEELDQARAARDKR